MLLPQSAYCSEGWQILMWWWSWWSWCDDVMMWWCDDVMMWWCDDDDDDEEEEEDEDDDDDDDDDDDLDDCKCGATSGLGRTCSTMCLNIFPPNPRFAHTQTTHPNNMIYLCITRGWMKTLAIRSDVDFKFSGFRVSGLRMFGFWGLLFWKVNNLNRTQGFEHLKGRGQT